MEILTVQIKGDGYLVNGIIDTGSDVNNPYYKEVKAWEQLGNTPDPEFTASEIQKQAGTAKWASVNTARAGLTVTTAAGNKFAANPDSITAISRKVASMSSAGSCTWYEDWGPFTVTKVELQEALGLANADDQALLDTLLA